MPAAKKTLARLTQLGLEALSAATAEIRPRSAVWPEQVSCLALTSPSGAARAGQLAPRRELPVFAVGDATADAARQAGFSDVKSASGDGSALAALLVRAAPPGPILHLRGKDQAFDLVAALHQAGRAASARIVYAAEPVEQLSDAALAALRPGAAVLIHSAKGAARFIDLVRNAGALRHIKPLRVVAISMDAAAPMLEADPARIDIAAAPTEDAVLAALLAAR